MVYLDLLFAQNVLIDYLLLSLTSIWRTEPVENGGCGRPLSWAVRMCFSFSI